MKRKSLQAMLLRFPELEPLVREARAEDVIVHVEPMDRAGLYRKIIPRYVGMFDTGRPGQVGISQESVYVSSEKSPALVEKRLSDPRSPRTPFTYERFLGYVSGLYSELPDPDQRVVVAQWIHWYDQPEDQRPIQNGRKLGQTVRIDVYLQPKDGLALLLESSDLSKNVCLSWKDAMRMWTDSLQGKRRPEGRMSQESIRSQLVGQRVENMLHNMLFGAYFRGIREAAAANPGWKSSGTIGEYSIRTWTTGDKLDVLIGSSDLEVTFQFSRDLDFPYPVLSGGEFALDDAEELVNGFVATWKKLWQPIPQPAMQRALRPVQ